MSVPAKIFSGFVGSRKLRLRSLVEVIVVGILEIMLFFLKSHFLALAFKFAKKGMKIISVYLLNEHSIIQKFIECFFSEAVFE